MCSVSAVGVMVGRGGPEMRTAPSPDSDSTRRLDRRGPQAGRRAGTIRVALLVGAAMSAGLVAGLWLAGGRTGGDAGDGNGAGVANAAPGRPGAGAAPAARSRPGTAIGWTGPKGVELLAVLDGAADSLCVYRYAAAPGGRKLELVAVRSIRFDLQLEDLNGAAPTPAQVKERLARDVAKDGGRDPADEGAGMPDGRRDAGSAGMTAVTIRMPDGGSVLAVVDPGRAGLCLYEYDPDRRRLRLAAARSLKYDFALQELNVEGLTPREVREAVQRAGGG